MRIQDVLRMFNVTEANHAPTAIDDTTMLRFHIAILKDKNSSKQSGLITIGRLSQRDDLHAENNDERGECQRCITHCLRRSVSSTALEKGMVRFLTILAITIGCEVDVNNSLRTGCQYWTSLRDMEPLHRQHRGSRR